MSIGGGRKKKGIVGKGVVCRNTAYLNLAAMVEMGRRWWGLQRIRCALQEEDTFGSDNAVAAWGLIHL